MNEDQTKGFAYCGKPAKGCRYCVKGEKLVLFITGLCSQRCFYCPISELKFGKDVIFANEWKIENDEDLLEEMRLMDAKGAGITGGDPLVTMNKTCKYIKLLKEKMGKDFHIHLYTPLKFVTEDNLKRLHEAGLDEIRFHPNIDDDKEWEKITEATKLKWDVGIEIPCLPDKEVKIKRLIKNFAEKIKFINLNELEFSDTSIKHYNLKDYELKNEQSYAAKSSEELAKKLIKYTEEKELDISVYYCSAKLKDKTQMGNRIKRRAKKVTKPYDIVTPEGMLIRGVIYLEELKPGFSYREKLAKADKAKILKKLAEEAEKVKKLGVKEIDIDNEKLRLLLPRREVKKNCKKIKRIGLAPAIVEEYPTKDSIEVEIELL